MDFDELPLFCMKQHCEPSIGGFAFLEEKSIVDYVSLTYEDRADQGKAFEGAFTGYHIQEHLSKRGDKETWMIEILGWYDLFEYRDLKSPFYDCLKVTLSSCNLGDFYEEAIDYIIENRGKLD